MWFHTPWLAVKLVKIGRFFFSFVALDIPPTTRHISLVVLADDIYWTRGSSKTGLQQITIFLIPFKIFLNFLFTKLIFVQFLLTNTEFDRFINAADEEAKDEVLKLKAQHLPVLNRTRAGSTLIPDRLLPQIRYPPFASRIISRLLWMLLYATIQNDVFFFRFSILRQMLSYQTGPNASLLSVWQVGKCYNFNTLPLLNSLMFLLQTILVKEIYLFFVSL